jgi:hypothetical protein
VSDRQSRKPTPVECDPAIVTLERVTTTSLADPPPRRPQAAQPRWAAPSAVEAPRTPLPYAPGPPPGYQDGPRPVPEQQPEDQRTAPPSAAEYADGTARVTRRAQHRGG